MVTKNQLKERIINSREFVPNGFYKTQNWTEYLENWLFIVCESKFTGYLSLVANYYGNLSNLITVALNMLYNL